MDTAEELLELAREKFGKLTEAEEKLFRGAANGEGPDYNPRGKKPIDPANTAKWSPSRVLLADRIAWLCTNRQASQFVTHRGIQIRGARIDEEFDLQHAEVPFPLFFILCRFAANINLQHAQIPALYMPGTHTGPLSAGGLKTDGPIYLRDGFQAEGEICLLSAMIGGDLDCSNARFSNPDGITLSGDGLKVEGGIFLNDGFKAEGEVSLIGAKVGGNFDCKNSQFENKDGRALSADGLKVGGSAYFGHGFQAKGQVRLLGATISGNLNCIKGHFINEKRIALAADGLTVGGDVFLRSGFKAEGEVRLPGAKIGGNLECDNSRFGNKDGHVLSADGLKVDGSVCLRVGFRAQGAVSFVGATIQGHFILANVKSPMEMTLDLNSAKIGTLHDDKIDSWPAPKHLVLHGLEYKEISHESPRDSKTRIEWVRLQKGFSPQPYEQLAKVLRDSGDGAGARDVLVAKNEDKATLTKLTFVEKCWYRFIGRPIGYGHKPWLALRLALVIILFGLLFFKQGYSHGLVTPLSDSAYAKEGDTGILAPGDTNRRISEVYPVFNSLVYSIDVFVPVVDLHQAKYWLPNANRGPELVPTSSAVLCTGGLLLFWLWFETACGWVLTTLFLVGLTGLVRT